jgi:lactoylglutathione lyase
MPDKGTNMRFLHTMVRISNIEESLDFYCNKLGLIEMRRHESEKGRFTLIFLAAPANKAQAEAERAPELELTYNWPDENGKGEVYTGGRSFGHLAYKVDNIHECCQHLMNSGVTINRPPRDGHMAFVKSPDGISIEILQEGDALTPQEPWVSMPNTGSW